MTPDNSLDFSVTRVQHTPMRLLIIEDDRDAAEYLVKAFREVGHVADWSADGEDGLAMAQDGNYDVLVVDRMLPKRDGLSVISALRSERVETPDADTTPVFVSRLHIKIPRALEWGRHEKVGQARLSDLVAVQHAALATLLIVDDEIDGEARPTGPTRVRRLVGIADEIARIAGHRRRTVVMPMSLSRGAIVMLPSIARNGTSLKLGPSVCADHRQRPESNPPKRILFWRQQGSSYL